MPVSIRNPFRKTAPPPAASFNTYSSDITRDDPLGLISSRSSLDEARPGSTTPPTTLGSRSTSKSKVNVADEERESYKLSVVNGNGIYLPPSPPPDKKPFWRRNESSSSNRNRPPIQPPSDEPFTISRESFDSYRRSFDISARSPITDTSNNNSGNASSSSFPRYSLDNPSSRPRASFDAYARPSRMSLDAPSPHQRMSFDSRNRPSPQSLTVPGVAEDPAEFEDVKLEDEGPKKTGTGRFSLLHRFEKGESRPASGGEAESGGGSVGGTLGGLGGRLFGHGHGKKQQQQQHGEHETVGELRRIEKNTPSVVVE